MVGKKITRPMVGQYKNNSPKGWVAQKLLAKGWTGGELNGQHESNSPKDRESNSKHENNSPKGWIVQK